jgi:NAD(P)-dependent dehydrogenase (short-subunit alcohol dehydrogenase family)
MAANNSGYEPVPLKSIRQMFELTGRNYIVTGGGQGIGFAVAQAICEVGGNVAILDIQEKPKERIETLAKQFGTKVEFFQTDVSEEKSLRSSFDQAISALGSLDGILAAAGIAIDKPFIEQSWAEAEKIQKINVSVLEGMTLGILKRVLTISITGFGIILYCPVCGPAVHQTGHPR